VTVFTVPPRDVTFEVGNELVRRLELVGAFLARDARRVSVSVMMRTCQVPRSAAEESAMHVDAEPDAPIGDTDSLIAQLTGRRPGSIRNLA
jgi:hypothetical protein